MTTAAYRQFIAATPRDRLDLFLATANRLGAPVGNVERDFWVCWTLNALYRERAAGGARLLFRMLDSVVIRTWERRCRTTS